MSHSILSRWRLASLPALAVWALVPTLISPAPTARAQGANAPVRTGDGMLGILATLPAEVRTGEQFAYEVTVANMTDNVVLHDIKIGQQAKSGLTIESVSVQGQQDQQQQDSQQKSDQKKSDQDKSDQKKSDQQKSDQKQSDQQKKDKQQSGQQQSSSDGGQGKHAITIDKLEPGESRTFVVKASTDSQGAVQSCLVVESYKPAICLQTKAVKPELQIVKTSPKQVNQCDVIELAYTVQNDGTGNVDQFQIIDELADGLETIDGEKRLAFTVDQLKAGDTRRFVARVFATKTGEFKSRATAKAENSDLKSRSQNVGPKVVGADLQVQLRGGGTVYSNQPAVFTAMVTNTGNARADNVQVDVRWPQQARLRNLSDPRMVNDDQSSNQSSSNSNNGSQSGQPKSQQGQGNKAVSEQSGNNKSGNNNSGNNDSDKQDSKSSGSNDSSNQQKSNQKSPQMEMSSEQLTIRRLDPGQTAQFDFVVGTNGMDRIPAEVEARYVCTVDQAEDVAEADVRKMAQAMAVIKIVRLPALQVYVVDGADPVALGDTVNYTIRVRNEGDAPDHQVQITADLPQELKFESAEGPTKFKQQGQQIVFNPIKKLDAGDEVEYTLSGIPQSEGEVILKVELESNALNSKVQSEEPTQLVKAQSNQQRR